MRVFPISLLLFLVFSINTVLAQQPHASGMGLGRFEKDVRDLTYRSLEQPPVPGCSLYVGSSSFTRWKEVEALFHDDDAVNRGFGGSHISYNIDALERIHLPYRPARVTFFCGGNDLASGKSVDTVFGDFKYYLARHWNENPLLDFFFVSITNAPVREKNWANGNELCEKVKDLASKMEGLYFVDIIEPMKGADGRVREDLFVEDRLHLNKEGYAIWTEAFRKAYTEFGSAKPKPDVRKLFQLRKELGLFDDPRFQRDGITVKAPREADLDLNIVFIGDSITIGGADRSPPNRCAAYLEKQAGIGQVSIANLGVNGFTTVDFVPAPVTKGQTEKGPQGESRPATRFVKVVEAANQFKDRSGKLVFSIMLGANDSAVNGPNGAPVSPDAYRNNLKLIVDRLLADYPEAVIVLHRPVWYSETTQNRSTYLLEGQLRVWAYFSELESLVDYYASTSDSRRVVLGDVKGFNYFKSRHTEVMRAEKRGEQTFYLHPNEPDIDILGRFWGAAILDRINH